MGNFLRQHAPSSMITSVAYDDFNNTLEVVFCHGGIYEYANISAETYHKLSTAESVGEYFNEHIRTHFSYRKVRD